MLYFHIDDFAVSQHSSQCIIKALKNGGKIASISVIPNMSCFQESLLTLLNSGYQGLLSVHLNFMEGHCVTDSKEIPLLVDNRGFFKLSWGALLLLSYLPFSIQKPYIAQLELEIKAQLDVFLALMPSDYQLRIDSHQHTHVIPIVSHALSPLLLTGEYKATYIRIPIEGVLPFCQEWTLYPTYSPTNVLKNILLNCCSIQLSKQLAPLNLQQALVWGVLMSGKMDAKRIKRIWHRMKSYADKRGQDVELIFHIGRMLPDEKTEEYVKPGFVKEHISKNRDIEYRSILSLSEFLSQEIEPGFPLSTQQRIILQGDFNHES